MENSALEAPRIAGGKAAHFVLTRFNVRSFYYAGEPSDDWLHNRLELFRRYCLPTLSQQSADSFTWLVFFDDQSPDWFQREVSKDAPGNFEAVYVRGAFTAETVSKAITERSSAPYILTTRVDNDDAVSRDFVQVIQSCFEWQDFEFINLVSGAQYAKKRTYLRPYTKNPFLSLMEASLEAPPHTVFVEHHYRVDERGPVRNVRTRHPMWLQVIHGGNVLNEIVGLRVPVGRIAGHFDCNLECDDRVPALAAEMSLNAGRILWRLVSKPARLRDLCRAFFARSARGA
ncbi:glycosyltransferase [Pseudarthrobacter phenanthrenivorans]|uniref:glycosyltransferase n=1 Tax=Pseudarthrobacter phenanthrenivorans TaxID=361575 RepID=UPI0015E84824|nr:glycosyltransferase [Pseudarthrobacter phenanthrenivorans]